MGPMLSTLPTSSLVEMAREDHEELMDPATGQHTQVETARTLVQIHQIIESRALDYALTQTLVHFGEEEDDLTSVLNPNDPLFAIDIHIEPFNHLSLWNTIIDRGYSGRA